MEKKTLKISKFMVFDQITSNGDGVHCMQFNTTDMTGTVHLYPEIGEFYDKLFHSVVTSPS